MALLTVCINNVTYLYLANFDSEIARDSTKSLLGTSAICDFKDCNGIPTQRHSFRVTLFFQ